jgi:hypothetical protein
MAKKTSPVDKAVKKKPSKAKGVKTIALESYSLEQQLAQREAELEIINSIQQGLAAELDFQGIVDLVGDRLREVFHAPDLGISWYDEKANLIHSLYMVEHGTRQIFAPYEPTPGGLFETMAKTHQPVVFNSLCRCKLIHRWLAPIKASRSSLSRSFKKTASLALFNLKITKRMLMKNPNCVC